MSIEAMKQALEALESINELSKPPMNIPLAAEIDGAMDALRQAIEQAEKESTLQEISDIDQWDTSDMAYRSGGLSVEQAQIEEYNDRETVMKYDDIKIVFTLKQIHFILDSLGKMPYSQTAVLYENIQKITAEQMPNPNNTNL
jgi:hypothetical protein